MTDVPPKLGPALPDGPPRSPLPLSSDGEAEKPVPPPKARPSGRPLLVRGDFWLALALILLALVGTVQWQHPQSWIVASGFGGLAVLSLIMAAWSLGRASRGSGGGALEAAADAGPDGIALSDAGGHIVYANAQFHRLLSYAAAEDARRQVAALAVLGDGLEPVYPAAADEVRRFLARIQEGGAGQVVFPVPRGPGITEWRRLTAHTLAGTKKNRGGAHWRVEDITAERELDIVRRDEEQRVSDFLDLLPVGFFSADGEGVLLHVNQTLARWLGAPPERLVGQPFADYVAEATEDGDLTLKDAEGRTFPVVLEQSQRDNKNGDVDYTRSVVLRDLVWGGPGAVTGDEEEQLEAAMGLAAAMAAPERLRWLFDEAPVGIVFMDLGGSVTDCNEAFLAMLGAAREDVIGHPLSDRLSREDRGDVSAGLSKIVMGISRGAQLEVRLPGSGGRQLTLTLYAGRVDDPAGDVEGLVLHFIDATEHKDLEVQFTQAQKMQAVGQLAGGVAHDFNNLLTAMIGFCDLLLTRHGPEDPSFADIQQIRQNANRATNLVRQLLAFSRKQALAPVKLNVTEALSELSNLLGRLIGETVELTMDHGRELPPVKVDKGQFDQVIINLTVNARDAMPRGGAITLRTSRAAIEVPVQRGPDTMPAGHYVLIEVADTGTGIARADLEHIFEPFFSTKDVGEGTGLGLSTVHGIVHQTGGFIFVDSAPGEGTTFSIYLPEFGDEAAVAAIEQAPANDADPAAPAPAAPEAPAAPAAVEEGDLTGQGTVLLVEDEDAVRMFGSRALRNKGYSVLEAANGEAALDVINSTDETIDLIISDVVMPGMDGHTLVNLVRQELPGLKVILISGYAEETFHEEIGRDDTITFLGKPFTLKALAGKVKEVLEG